MEVVVQLKDEDVDRIIMLCQLIFGSEKLEKTKHKLIQISDPVLIYAKKNHDIVGFKLGYPLSSKLFYSWIGGVLSNWRRLGLAKKMLQTQHAVVKELGYQTIRTKTEHRFEPMLVLNLKEGFQIIDRQKEKIIMEKHL